MKLSPLAARRWRNFRRNGRAFWSLIIFALLFVISIFAEFVANDRPIMVSYRGELYFPVVNFYPETTFNSDLKAEAIYNDPAVQCLIETGGRQECWDDPAGVMAEADETGQVGGEPVEAGWVLWPPIPYSYSTLNNLGGPAPSAPDAEHWLGTDSGSRDVLALVIYGFRTSVMFALLVTVFTAILGIAAGAVQGYFGGRTDLIFQRFLEIWSSIPTLFALIIVFAAIGRGFWILVIVSIIFGWPALVGVVRAEFLRARNLEYVRAARALGVSDRVIMFRHMLPNAMVATLTMLPFLVTGAVASLTALDYLGFGLPADQASLGLLTLDAKQNLQAPWLGLTAFFSLAIMLSLLIFIFEGVRDAFDPRKTFR